MNWPLAFRKICAAYPGVTPLDLERMHLDQIVIMLADEKFLETGRRLVKGTPKELAAQGLIDTLPDMSLVERIKRHQGKR